MSISNLFWIFLMLIAVQPVIQQKVLEYGRLRLLGRLEKRGSRVIALVHRQETRSLLGLPLVRYIDVHDSEEVLPVIKLTGEDVPIDLIIHTPGGLALAVAHALAADEIVMDPTVLGPVDPQLSQFPGGPEGVETAGGRRPGPPGRADARGAGRRTGPATGLGDLDARLRRHRRSPKWGASSPEKRWYDPCASSSRGPKG